MKHWQRQLNALIAATTPPPEPEPGEWWQVAGTTPLIVYQPKGAASVAASYINLANPGTYNIPEPPFEPIPWDAVNGWKFNGSTNYLATGYAEASVATTVIIRVSNYTGGQVFFGSKDAAGDWIYIKYLGTPPLTFAHALNYQEIATTIGADTLAVAGQTGWKNGIKIAANINGGPTYSNMPIVLGAFNNDGSITQHVQAYMQAVWISALTPSDGNMAILMANMAAL